MLQLMGGWLLNRKAESAEEEALLQPFLHEFYGKKLRGRAGTTSLLSQSKFSAWSCNN